MARRMSLSSLSYASFRSINNRCDKIFLFLFISRIELRMNILSLQVLEDLKPFCSGPIISSFLIASPNLLARIFVRSFEIQLIRVMGL